jgi:glycosyltransferase involved in cell wall biosynthesis
VIVIAPRPESYFQPPFAQGVARCSVWGIDYPAPHVDQPIRILLLGEARAAFQAERAGATLHTRLGTGFETCVRRFAPGEYRDLAQAVLGLRRTGAAYDIIHTFGRRALTAAALGSQLPIVYCPDPVAPQRDIAWARAVITYRDVTCVFPTATQQRMHVERGIPMEQCRVIRPGVDFSRIRRRRDPKLRALLGFDETDRVLLACGESTVASNHRETFWATAILHLLDSRYKLLLWGKGDALHRIRHLAATSPLPDAVIVATDLLGDVAFEALLPASDAVLVNAPGAVPTLPIAIAMGAGLPIVSTVTYTTSELLEDRHTALMVPASRPRQFARRVLDLYADPRLQWSIAETARAEAYEFHAQTAFLNGYRALYQRIAGREIVQPPISNDAARELQYQA